MAAIVDDRLRNLTLQVGAGSFSAGGVVVVFVVMASIFHGLFTPWLAPKFPKFFRHGYEPLFFNAGLSFAEKIAKWRVRPTTSEQLVTSELMLAVASIR